MVVSWLVMVNVGQTTFIFEFYELKVGQVEFRFCFYSFISLKTSLRLFTFHFRRFSFFREYNEGYKLLVRICALLLYRDE